ncbi:hypothetical protein RhiLY_08169 [Ceratobasidium sp. AG-Ba]|nr:hypothetical protein RhiLY_08169 [Ceratobasidium sp. AG-Ba]
MFVEHTHWAGRAGFPTAGVLRLPHDVLVEVACLLDVPALLSLRQACRVLSVLTREPVIFVRLQASTRIPPLPKPLPASLAPSPEQRVLQACRLHKNWDLAAFPVTVRTVVANRAPVMHPSVLPPLAKPVTTQVVPPVDPPLAAPLPYHLPPVSLDPDPPLHSTSLDEQHTPGFTSSSSHGSTSLPAQSTRPSHSTSQPHHPQSLPAPTPYALRPGVGNWATVTLRTMHASTPLDLGLTSSDAMTGSGLGPMHIPTASGTPGPVSSVSSPPPAPAPRPTRVASIPARAIHARIVAGGRWGVFVVKHTSDSGSGANVHGDKGKQRADTLPLTAEALAHLSQNGIGKGKAKAAPVDEGRLVQQGESSGPGVAATKGDGDPYVVIYDLEAMDGTPEKGRMAEHAMTWSPAGMACRATSTGVVIVLTSGPKEAVPQTTVLKWSYDSPKITPASHKSKCPLGSIAIQEYEQGKTLVAVVHRPTTVMIQDIDSRQRCFIKLSKIPPRHTIQAVHLIPGPHLLVVRKVQMDDPSGQPFVLEEYDVPPMGESVYPDKPVQRQWIRGMDLHNITLCEGPTYEGGAKPDIALWAFSTLPNRAMVHWILRAGPKTGIGTVDPGADIPTAHPTDNLEQPQPELPAIERDIYSDEPETMYTFPIERVSVNQLSFPHHKATLAPGARRALWFERPERSRTGEARGMRGVWAYSAVESKSLLGKGRVEKDGPVVRNCTREMPEDVLNSMENNTLGVAFDESSGRAVILTCGDSYGAANGGRIWVLDYA